MELVSGGSILFNELSPRQDAYLVCISFLFVTLIILQGNIELLDMLL